MKNSLIAITLFLFFTCFQIAAFDWDRVEADYELSYQFANGFEQNGITRSRPYIVAKYNYNQSSSDSEEESEATDIKTYEVSFRLWNDFAKVQFQKNVDLRSLFYEHTGDKWSAKLGFQEVAWGETFGLFIADIVNPRQLTDPFFNELSFIRIAVCMLNLQYFHEPWSFQLIATPIPMNNQLPAKGDPFAVFPEILEHAKVLRPKVFRLNRWGKDCEYGCKAGYFFESGLDLSLFYFRHWNRFPVYKVKRNEFRLEQKPVLRRINTLGSTFSKAFESFVLRGDTVLNFRQPWTVHEYGIVKQRFVIQSILGLDFNSEDNMTLGLQYHWDHWREGDLHSLSFKYLKDFGKKQQYHIVLFAYKGVNNQDLWVQPQFIWDASDSLTISIRSDLFGGKVGRGTPSTGFIGPYRHKDRVFVWMTYMF